MRTIYLIRHGHTLWNEERRYQGVADQPLSLLGQRQAEKLAVRFRKIPVAHIFSSPSSRAIQTIQQVAEEKGLPIQKNTNLREIDFGKWEGCKEEDLIKAYGGYEYYPDFLRYPDRWRAPGEQLFSEAQPRITACVEQIIREYPQGDLVIVSHAGVLKLLLMKWLCMENHDTFLSILLDNTSISAVRLEGNNRVIQRINDVAHLEMED